MFAKNTLQPMEVTFLSRKAVKTKQDNYIEITHALIRGINFRDHLDLGANHEGLPKLRR